jgi:hypothetical protein
MPVLVWNDMTPKWVEDKLHDERRMGTHPFSLHVPRRLNEPRFLFFEDLCTLLDVLVK